MSLRPPFYVISDTHFFHDNIVKFCGRSEQVDKLVQSQPHLSYVKQGPWDHNAYMVNRWNAVVGKDDVILHLGDVFLWRGDGMSRYMTDIMPRLNGKKYLILGNHDKSDLHWDSDFGYEVIEPFTMSYEGLKVSFDHYPCEPGVLHPTGKHVRVHGHIHNNGYPKGKGQHGWREGTTQDSPMQVNVSVEMVDYTPQSINALLAPYVR